MPVLASRSPVRGLRLACLVLLVSAAIPLLAPAVHAAQPDPSEMYELSMMASDPARAAQAVPRVRTLLASGVDSSYTVFLRITLVKALMVSRAPVSQVLAAADTIEALGMSDARVRTGFLAQMADALIRRGERLERAADYAKRAMAACPPGPDQPAMRATCERLLGQAQLGLGRLEAAIVSLSNAAAAAADSEVVLFQLGRAFEKKGQADDAINAYIRSLGVFPRGDTTAAAPLRALYARHHGSLSGLDARIDVARRASTQRVALEARRYDAPAPDWKLPDLSGGTLESASFKGKVVVLDFWGSWCGPCRAELPYFQAMYDRYKDRGVAFVGINWEREPTAEKRIAAARSFIASKGFSFPVALDLDHKTVEAYAVESFPTLLVIDKVGRMRYRNAGFSPDIEPILTAQIESLIE